MNLTVATFKALLSQLVVDEENVYNTIDEVFASDMVEPTVVWVLAVNAQCVYFPNDALFHLDGEQLTSFITTSDVVVKCNNASYYSLQSRLSQYDLEVAFTLVDPPAPTTWSKITIVEAMVVGSLIASAALFITRRFK